MIFTLNFHKFLHTMYKHVLNPVVKISLMFAQYFDYYTILLRGPIFVDKVYIIVYPILNKPSSAYSKLSLTFCSRPRHSGERNFEIAGWPHVMSVIGAIVCYVLDLHSPSSSPMCPNTTW